MQHLEPCPNPEAGGYLALQVHHGLLKRLRWSPLVVTQNGNRSVGTVIGKDLRWDVIIRCKAKESGEQFVFHRAEQPQPALPNNSTSSQSLQE